MSILSSTNTGKLKIIQDELERVYPETNNAAFRIVELENYYKKYKVIFSAKTGAGGIHMCYLHSLKVLMILNVLIECLI